MEELVGLMRIRVKRGINLARRDTLSSDPFVVITMDRRFKNKTFKNTFLHALLIEVVELLNWQRLKTRTVAKNCNPEWNEELTIAIKNINEPVNLMVYDEDTFTADDKMGDAQIDIMPLLDVHSMKLQELKDGTVIKRVFPTGDNCLSDESRIIFNNGKILQDMVLVLRNVECGKVEIQLEWIEIPSVKGL